MKLSRVGVDLAKNVYQLHGVVKWTPLVGLCGSVFKVESDIVVMLPVRAV